MRNEIQKRLSDLKHTSHALLKEFQEGITAWNLNEALKEGFEIIEEYPDDPRGASCLVLCRVVETPIHVVCAPHEEALIVISVYRPDEKKWSPDFRTRR